MYKSSVNLVETFKGKRKLVIHFSVLFALTISGITTGYGYDLAFAGWLLSGFWFMINILYPFGDGIVTRKAATIYTVAAFALMLVTLFGSDKFAKHNHAINDAKQLLKTYETAIIQDNVEWVIHENQSAALATIWKHLPDKAPEFAAKLNEFNSREDVKKKTNELSEARKVTASIIAAQEKEKIVRRTQQMIVENKKLQAEHELHKFGDAPIRSQWDGSYFVITQYLKSVMNDPDSLVIENCGLPHYHKTGWIIACDYRGKNGFGGYVRKSSWFTVQYGVVVKESGAGAFRF